jgi:hypothetical protein
MATPYRGRVELGDSIVNAKIDDIDSPSWQGAVRELPVIPFFSPGPVDAQLLQGELQGWRAAADVDIASDGTAVLHGREPFKGPGA